MNKKVYLVPTLRIIDLVEEGMIAESIVMDASQDLGEDGEFTQKQESNIWDRDGIWK